MIEKKKNDVSEKTDLAPSETTAGVIEPSPIVIKKEGKYNNETDPVFTEWISGESVAFGAYSQASGSASVGGGIHSWAIGDQSVAFGQGSRAEGESSLAVGGAAYAYGQYCISLGASAYALGNRSVSVGSGARCDEKAFNSVAIGPLSQVHNSYSTAIGYSSVVTDADFHETDVAGVVSFGQRGLNRRLLHVADGIEDDDSVNVKQLNEIAKLIPEEVHQPMVFLVDLSFDHDLMDGNNARFNFGNLSVSLRRRETEIDVLVNSKKETSLFIRRIEYSDCNCSSFKPARKVIVGATGVLVDPISTQVNQFMSVIWADDYTYKIEAFANEDLSRCELLINSYKRGEIQDIEPFKTEGVETNYSKKYRGGKGELS